MTLRISLLPLALTALALPAPVLASPHGQRDYIVHAYPQGHLYGQPPTAYLVRPQGVVVQPQFQPVRPLPPVHPGFPPAVVNHYGYPVTDYPSGVYQGQPGPTLASGNGLFSQPRTCTPMVPLVGAALGGTVGAVMAHKSRNRRWALPMGAAVGGLLGGVASGC
jgi:hypothetical protein